MPLQPGASAFRYHRTNVPGIVVVYFGTLAHRDTNRASDPVALHPSPATNARLLARAEHDHLLITSTYLENYCTVLPSGAQTAAQLTTFKDFIETDDLGPILYIRTLYVFGDTQAERDSRAALAQTTVELDTANQLTALAQILRLGRDNPLCPSFIQVTHV